MPTLDKQGYFDLKSFEQPKTQAKPPKKKQGGVKGWLTSLIGEAGGTGGALAGAGTGAAIGSIVPGIGTAVGGLVGAGLGGFLGGTGGQLVENKVRDDEWDVNKALKSGAVEGVLGAGPIKLAKAGYGAAKGLKGALRSEDVIENVLKSRGIPVKFEESLVTGAPEKVLTTKGIPVKYESSTASGAPVKDVKNKFMVNPTGSEISSNVDALKNQGYSVKSTGRSIKGRKSLAGPTVFEPSDPVSAIRIRGEKTNVPFATEASSGSEILNNSPDLYGKTNVGFSDKGIKSKGVIETPSTYEPVLVPGSRDFSVLRDSIEQQIQTPLLSRLPGAKKLGAAMTGSAAGLKPGKEVGALENVDQTAQMLAEMGIKGTPKNQAKLIQNKLGELGKQVDDVLTATPIKVDGAQVGNRLKQASQDLTDERFIDLDLTNPSVQNIIDRYSKKFAATKDAKGINDIVKTLNKVASKAEEKLRNPTAAGLTAQETAVLALKRAGDDVLSGVEEIRPIKQQMATLYGANPDVIAASQKGIGLPMASGISAKSPKQQTKGLLSRVGANLQGAPQPVTSTSGIIARNVAGNAANPVSDQPQLEEMPDLAAPEELGVDTPTDVLGFGATGSEDVLGFGGGTPTNEQNPFGQENIQKLIIQDLANGGKNVDTLMKLYETFGATAASSSKPLSAEASKVQGITRSGLDSLAQLSKMIEDGGVPKGTTVPGRGLLGGLGQNVLGTSSYDAAADNIADAMVRLRTGAAATKEELALYRRLLPQAFDSPEVQQQKMQQVYDYFSNVSGGMGSAGTDLQQAVGI